MSNRPITRTVRTLESYIAYTPPIVDAVEDSERGVGVAYEDRWADELFTWLSSGRAIVSYCQQPGKPARSLLLTWLQDDDPTHDHLRDRFEKGMMNRALALIDDSADIAEEDLLMGPKGFLDPVSAADKKNRVETKLKLAALLDPAKFSPTSKIAQQIAVTQINNITQKNVTEMTDEALLRVIAEAQRRMARGSTANSGATSGDRGTGTVSTQERPQLPS